MRGDVLFYSGGGSLADRLISWRTHGPFVHVEVDLGDGTAIGSLSSSGVDQHPVDYTRAVVYRPSLKPDEIEAGIAWLRSHVGDPYGWGDILNFVLTLFVPNSPLVLAQRHGFDCSDLVARYLEAAGGTNLGPQSENETLSAQSARLARFDETSLLSPNDLARALGVLSQRS